jgi:hypothetical protein
VGGGGVTAQHKVLLLSKGEIFCTCVVYFSRKGDQVSLSMERGARKQVGISQYVPVWGFLCCSLTVQHFNDFHLHDDDDDTWLVPSALYPLHYEKCFKNPNLS